MKIGLYVLLLSSFSLVACDRIMGDSTQQTLDTKILDAKAIGYACRVSLKKPEDCMKENDAHSPSSILAGWRDADKDIQDKSIDPSMSANRPAPVSAVSASQNPELQKTVIPKKAK